MFYLFHLPIKNLVVIQTNLLTNKAMKSIYSFIMLGLFLLLGSSCENDGFYYQDQSRIRMEGPEIWTLETDSLEFSFITTPSDVVTQQMDVTLYVMGVVADYDRTVQLETVADKTTATDDLYEYPTTVVIPAGSNYGICPVILKRADILQEKTVRLFIRVVASDDFAVGSKEQDHLLLKWNDQLSKPSNWDDLEEFFGTYSDNKYRFMLNNTGVSEFDTETMTWAELRNYKIMLTNLLNELEEPVLDENTGLPISFDN